MNPYDGFQRKKDFLICIDSDGCVMDTMNIKHIKCFSPCVIEEWGLEPYGKEVDSYWNKVNLYSNTRGINRFHGLVRVLMYVNETYAPITDLESLIEWTKKEPRLSEHSLKDHLGKQKSCCLEKALHWSEEVNRRISLLPEEAAAPFEGAKEAISTFHETCDIAIVSSANYEAVLTEWERFGLTSYVDIILAQNAGSKAHCIRELLKSGYEENHVLMIGDAPGDLEAARENGIFYYPILADHETDSWREAPKAVSRLLCKTYEGAYQEEKIKEFLQNLET